MKLYVKEIDFAITDFSPSKIWTSEENAFNQNHPQASYSNYYFIFL